MFVSFSIALGVNARDGAIASRLYKSRECMPIGRLQPLVKVVVNVASRKCQKVVTCNLLFDFAKTSIIGVNQKRRIGSLEGRFGLPECYLSYRTTKKEPRTNGHAQSWD